MKHRLMTHMIASYPDGPASVDVATAMIDGGCSYLEIQFPFSDPTADGPVIQTACTHALEEGFSVEGGFQLVKTIRDRSDIPIFIMCYGNTLFYSGIESFVARCAGMNVQGLIVPDLPFDYDEGMFGMCKKHGLVAIPVVAPTITEARLRAILGEKPLYVYAALRKGITGEATQIGKDNIGFLEHIKRISKDVQPRILAGFGISRREQVELLAPHVHASIVGSAFVRIIMEQERHNVYSAVKDKMAELT